MLAPGTLSSAGSCFCLRTGLDLPRPRSRGLLELRAGRPRHDPRAWRGTQLAQQVGDGLRRRAMLGSKGVGVLATIPVLCPQLAQPRLSPLRDRDLRDQAAQDELAGKIEPVRGERVDDIRPVPLFESIQACWRFRAALPGNDGYD